MFLKKKTLKEKEKFERKRSDAVAFFFTERNLSPPAAAAVSVISSFEINR